MRGRSDDGLADVEANATPLTGPNITAVAATTALTTANPRRI
jgi:hypothetical protein